MSDSEQKVYDEVLALLQRYNREGRELRPETDLNAELNIDSVAAMDLIMELEDKFDIDIPINLVADLRTVQDLVATVVKQQGTA
ncbi:MAG TPA: acyl carrier protein [Kiloniellales bacterium]|nr:acyl carrier protein [Kiloniellales bacterium]